MNLNNLFISSNERNEDKWINYLSNERNENFRMNDLNNRNCTYNIFNK